MASWIMDVLVALSYPGLALLMFIENIFPPIPSELIMPLAGFLAAQGKMSFTGIVVAGTVGSVLGALPLYWLGLKLGKARLERLAERHGRWLTVSPEDIDSADDWFGRHGRKAMFLGRLVPGVRSLIAIPAGLHEMPMAPFLMFTMLGSALWTAALAGAGYQLGAQFSEVEKYLDPVSWVVFGGGFLWYLWRVVRQGKGRRAS